MGKVTIKKIRALEILDSRGNPTVRAEVILSNGVVASASVPSGASTGVHEALELRDGDKKRYRGMGVKKAVKNVNVTISKLLQGKDVNKLRALDQLMIKKDGTQNKSRLGANAILGASLACAHAGAKANSMPLYKHLRKVYNLKYKGYKLPIATMNVLNGGAHADWSIDIQETMIVPMQATFSERLRCGSEIFHALNKILKSRGLVTLKGDEGGYAPKFNSNEQALKTIIQAITKAGYIAGKQVKIAMDPAASEFYDAKTKQYILKADKKRLSSTQMIDLLEKWSKSYPFISIEDGLAEDDWEGWVELTKRLGSTMTLVGDDLLVTDVARLKRAIKSKVGNAILIKVNQIGSMSESIDAITIAHKNKYKTSISHRSGETADTTIADLSVAVNSEFIKTGSLSRSERVAKYNRLLEIEAELKR